MLHRNAAIYILVILLAVLVDFFLITQWRRKRSGQNQKSAALGIKPGFLYAPSPVLDLLRKLSRPVLEKIPFQKMHLPPGLRMLFQHAVRLVTKIAWGSLLELCVICLWAAWVSSPLLITPADAIPSGGEFANLTQTHAIWTLLPRCGVCFLWNGSINGGAPAFAELTGAVLHPLVFIPVLLWGVVQGAKVTYFASLALAGMAQWGLARALGLGWWPRMWSGFLIVVGGHLSSKMENGDIGLVLGLACAALALTFGVDLLFNRNRKSLVWLSAALALTLLSGEGYIQVAVVLTLLPTLGLLCLRLGKHFPEDKQAQPAWRDYLLALGLTILLGGIFLAPLLHFLPEMGKDADASLSNFPPLEYLPLNLVIRDLNFHRTPILGKDPYLATHMIYIGWAPVLLAFLALRFAPARMNRLVWVFFTGIGLVFLITSADLPRALLNNLPGVGLLRHLTVASGLVVPLIVGLAAASLDEISQRLANRLRSWTPLADLPGKVRNLLAGLPGHLAMAGLAVLSIMPCYTLSQEFLSVRETRYLDEHMQVIQTGTAQWIQPPYGFYEWTPRALEHGMKIGHTWRPWHWEDREAPPAYIEVVFLPKSTPSQTPFQTIGGYGFLLHPEGEYASVAVQNAVQPVACQASSQGGWIDVTCDTHSPGLLSVHENAWQGWYAWVDGKPIHLIEGQWLRVAALAGEHHYQFRYLPWDVLLGAILTLVGIGLAIWVYQRV